MEEELIPGSFFVMEMGAFFGDVGDVESICNGRYGVGGLLSLRRLRGEMRGRQTSDGRGIASGHIQRWRVTASRWLWFWVKRSGRGRARGWSPDAWGERR